MLVETFEVTEVSCDGVVEFEQEQIALIEKMGLEGQQGLIKTGEEGEKNLLPYRKMTAEEKIVYETICPTKCKLNGYADSAIPLRVLQVAAHVSSLEMGTLRVWAADNSDVKDPVLVLETGSNYSYQYYILARWGEVLESFQKLKVQAFAKLKSRKREMLKSLIPVVQSRLGKVDNCESIESLNDISTSVSEYDAR